MWRSIRGTETYANLYTCMYMGPQIPRVEYQCFQSVHIVPKSILSAPPMRPMPGKKKTTYLIPASTASTFQDAILETQYASK